MADTPSKISEKKLGRLKQEKALLTSRLETLRRDNKPESNTREQTERVNQIEKCERRLIEINKEIQQETYHISRLTNIENTGISDDINQFVENPTNQPIESNVQQTEGFQASRTLPRTPPPNTPISKEKTTVQPNIFSTSETIKPTIFSNIPSTVLTTSEPFSFSTPTYTFSKDSFKTNKPLIEEFDQARNIEKESELMRKLNDKMRQTGAIRKTPYDTEIKSTKTINPEHSDNFNMGDNKINPVDKRYKLVFDPIIEEKSREIEQEYELMGRNPQEKPNNFNQQYEQIKRHSQDTPDNYREKYIFQNKFSKYVDTPQRFFERPLSKHEDSFKQYDDENRKVKFEMPVVRERYNIIDEENENELNYKIQNQFNPNEMNFRTSQVKLNYPNQPFVNQINDNENEFYMNQNRSIPNIPNRSLSNRMNLNEENQRNLNQSLVNQNNSLIQNTSFNEYRNPNAPNRRKSGK